MAEIKPARKTAPRKVKLTPPKVPAAPAPKTDKKPWKPAPAGGRHYGGGSTPAPARNTSRKTASPDAKTTVTKTAAAKSGGAKSAAKSGLKKAAAAEVAGGGPEDPLADVAAAGSLLGSLKSGGKKAASKAPAAGSSFASNPRRLILAEFLVCFVVLGLGTIVAPSGRPNGGAGHLAVKGSALALLFFILALMTGGGDKARKTAEGLGGLVTVAYLFTSQDAASLVKWMSSFFGGSSTGASVANSAGAAAAAAGQAGETEAQGIGQAIGNLGSPQ